MKTTRVFTAKSHLNICWKIHSHIIDQSVPKLDKVFVSMPRRPIWDELSQSRMIYTLSDIWSTCRRAFLTTYWRGGGIRWTLHFRIRMTKAKHRFGSNCTLHLAGAVLLTISFLAIGLICIIYIFEQPLYSVLVV